jgi:hypothetical protein
LLVQDRLKSTSNTASYGEELKVSGVNVYLCMLLSANERFELYRDPVLLYWLKHNENIKHNTYIAA